MISAGTNHSDQMHGAPTSRSPPNNLAETRCAVTNMTALSNHCLEPPLAPGAKDAPLSTDLSPGRCLPAPKVLAIARKAMRDALLSEGLAGQLGEEVVGLQSGVTIDLSRSAIPELPEELVDIFKDKLERFVCETIKIMSMGKC